MNPGASLAFPGSRTLTAWWRQLASHRPEGLWVGHCLFHQVHAPVVVLHPARLQPLESFVLRAVAATAAPAAALPDLAGWLQLEPPLILRLLRHLEVEGLVELAGGHTAAITAIGRHALANGDYPRSRRERRLLSFWCPDWTSPAPSRFVHLPHPDWITWHADQEAPFAVEDLMGCVRQSPEWKDLHAFPQEIREVLARPAGDTIEALNNIIVATPQRCFAVVVRTRSAAGPVLLGFGVNARNWELNAVQPAFTLLDDVEGWFAPAAGDMAWRQALGEWCRQRQIPEAEMERWNLKIEGERLVVVAPPEWSEKLRGGRGETWLLAGDGAMRTALRLDFAGQSVA